MKRIIIFIVAILTYYITNAQVPLSYKFSNRDDVSFKGADSGIKTYPWNNGILYLGFCYDSLSSKIGFCITYYDTLGTKIWCKSYYSNEYKMYEANDIIALNNTSFYIGGTVYKDSIYQEDRLFAKFNSDGDTVYTKIYHDFEQNWEMSMDKFCSDTILMLSAKTPSYADPYTMTVVCKIDTFGNITSMYEGSYCLYIPYKIIKGPGDYIYVGGTRSTSSTSSYNVKAFVYIIHNDLTLNCILNPSTTLNEYFAGMFVKNNMLYLARNVTVYDPPNQNAFYICRLSYLSLDGFVWHSKDIGPMNFDAATGSFINIDSNTLVVQVYFTLYFLDNGLNLICESNDLLAPDYNPDTFRGLSALPNKMIAGTGSYSSDSIHSQDHWNFLTMNIENYIISNTLNIKEFNNSSNKISIYPNPTSTNLTIETSSNTKQGFEICNLLGQTLYTSYINKKAIVDVSNFPKGIYIIKINTDKDTIVKKFVKE